MRRRSSYLLTALAVAASLLVGPALPASAGLAAPAPAPTAVKMKFDASPEPVAKGATVTLTGRVWQAADGNQARVDFSFRAASTPAGPYIYQGYATTTDAGTFTRRFTAQTTGTWKAVYAGSTNRRNAARLDAVVVFQQRSKEIATWSQTSPSWQSPTLRIPTRTYKAIATWTCAAGPAPFLNLTWAAQGGGSEFVNAEKPAGTMTLAGQVGERSGTFKVTSAAGCTWQIRVFSGIAAFQV